MYISGVYNYRTIYKYKCIYYIYPLYVYMVYGLYGVLY